MAGTSALQQGQTGGVVTVSFQLAQLFRRFQQGAQQRFLHVAGANHPCRDAVNRGVEEIETDVHAVEQVVTDDFAGDRRVSSSSSTTWSLSQRTGRLTCSSDRGIYSMAAEILSEMTSVGWKWPASRHSAVWRLVAYPM